MEWSIIFPCALQALYHNRIILKLMFSVQRQHFHQRIKITSLFLSLSNFLKLLFVCIMRNAHLSQPMLTLHVIQISVWSIVFVAVNAFIIVTDLKCDGHSVYRKNQIYLFFVRKKRKKIWFGHWFDQTFHLFSSFRTVGYRTSTMWLHRKGELFSWMPIDDVEIKESSTIAMIG